MKLNMGAFDRVARIIAAIVLVALYIGNVITGTWGIVALVVAGILLLTSVVGFCPLYAPFRFSTKSSRKKEEKVLE